MAGKHRRIEDYVIKDPIEVRVVAFLAKWLVCPIVGCRPVRKHTGVIPCSRHD